ncbi:hypothetical protein B0H13DRAFT_1885294 [Mycena leptocephala]|nr:hypothetical protein B0H13DRAFT_1885294 [Mycena leptocephala]
MPSPPKLLPYNAQLNSPLLVDNQQGTADRNMFSRSKDRQHSAAGRNFNACPWFRQVMVQENYSLFEKYIRLKCKHIMTITNRFTRVDTPIYVSSLFGPSEKLSGFGPFSFATQGPSFACLSLVIFGIFTPFGASPAVKISRIVFILISFTPVFHPRHRDAVGRSSAGCFWRGSPITSMIKCSGAREHPASTGHEGHPWFASMLALKAEQSMQWLITRDKVVQEFRS